MFIKRYIKYIPIALIILLSLGLHAHWLHSMEGFWDAYGSRDARKYHEMAWQFINHGIYGYNSTSSNAYVTPGLPFYLIGVFKMSGMLGLNYITVFKICNMLVSVTTVLLVYLISLKIWKNLWVANFAALLYGTYFTAIHFYRTYLTETPSVFLFCLTVLLFIIALEKSNWKWHAAFGIIASIALMFRPSTAPILLLALGIMIYKIGIKKAFKYGLIWCIGPLLIMLPWVIRNEIQFNHAYLFSSHSGNPLLGGTNPFELEDTQQIVKDAHASGMSDKKYAMQRIKTGFSEDFKLWFSWYTVGKTISLFELPAQYQNYQRSFSDFANGFVKNQHLFIVIGALITAIIFRKDKKLQAVLGIVIAYIAISNVFITNIRYGFFIIPVLCIVTSYGAVRLIKEIGVKTSWVYSQVKKTFSN